MSGFLTRYDAIEDSRTRTVVYDDGQFDYVEVRDPETGQLVRKPIAATPEELRQTEIHNLRGNLASVEERLSSVEELWPDALPTERAEKIAERRAGLEAEREVIRERLAVLEAATEPKRRRR
jgi:hypothetical protein